MHETLLWVLAETCRRAVCGVLVVESGLVSDREIEMLLMTRPGYIVPLRHPEAIHWMPWPWVQT